VIIQQILYIMQSYGEGTSNKKPYTSFFIRHFPHIDIEPPLENLNVDLKEWLWIITTTITRFLITRTYPSCTNEMNLVENMFLDGCAQERESNEQLKGVLEEEYSEPSNEIAMVIGDMFPDANLTDDDEVLQETLAVQTRSKEPVIQQQLIVSQAQNTRKSWIVNPTIRPNHVFYDMHKPSTIYSESMEYNVVEYVKKIKANILILDICKISHQCKLLLNALKDEEMQPSTSSKSTNKTTGKNM